MKGILKTCLVLAIVYASQVYGVTFSGPGGGLTPNGTNIGVTAHPVVVSGMPSTTINDSSGPELIVPATLGYNTVLQGITLNDVQHTFAADLDLRLISPAGTIFAFSSDNGGSTGLDTASDMIFLAVAPDCADDWTSSSASAQPSSGLQFETSENICGPIEQDYLLDCSTTNAQVDGVGVNGTWTLQVTDDAGGDTGTFASVELTFVSKTAEPQDSDGRSIRPAACAPVISSFPYEQDFDEAALCGTGPGNSCDIRPVDGWFNSTADDIDWTVDSAGTGSGSTGPPVDHSDGTSAGRYLYTESSVPSGSPNAIAHLESPRFDLSRVSAPTLTFWYHMLGETQGTMHVDVDPNADGNWMLDVIPPWTDNLNAWQKQSIDLKPWNKSTEFRFRVRGITGASFTSDMAVDDFRIADESLCVSAKIDGGGVVIFCL